MNKLVLLLLASLLVLPLSGCYNMTMAVAMAREHHKLKKDDKAKVPQTAQENAPEAVAPQAVAHQPSATSSGTEVGQMLVVRFEEAATVQTFAATDAHMENHVLENDDSDVLMPGEQRMMVTVIRQLPDGRVSVRGQRSLGPQSTAFIQLDGVIDKHDIDSNAVVASNRLLDVRLSYHGRGSGAHPPELTKLAHYFVEPTAD